MTLSIIAWSLILLVRGSAKSWPVLMNLTTTPSWSSHFLTLSSKCWFILSMIGLTDLSGSIVVCESVINVSLIGLAEKCMFNSFKWHSWPRWPAIWSNAKSFADFTEEHLQFSIVQGRTFLCCSWHLHSKLGPMLTFLSLCKWYSWLAPILVWVVLWPHGVFHLRSMKRNGINPISWKLSQVVSSRVTGRLVTSRRSVSFLPKRSLLPAGAPL